MTDAELEESIARRMDAADEAQSRRRENVLSECRSGPVPEVLAEILADDDDFLNRFIPEGLPEDLFDYLKEIIIENIGAVIYFVTVCPTIERRDPPMCFLYDSILEAIDKMEDEE